MNITNITNIKNIELAEFLGVSPGFANHIRRGRRKVPPKYCVRISKEYGIPLHVLRPDIYPEK